MECRKGLVTLKLFFKKKNLDLFFILSIGTISIEKPFLNRLMCSHLCEALCRTVEKYDILFHGKPEWKEKVLNSKTIREFDDNFTAVHFGFENVDHYYETATLHNKLHLIKVPTLCLSAADDPFQPYDAIPISEAQVSTHVAILVTARGGHIGFLDGIIPDKNQYMARIFAEYFSAVLNDKHEEFKDTLGQITHSVSN